MGELRELKTDRAQVNQSTVDLLKSWLADAEAGEFTGVVIIGTRDDGTWSFGRSATTRFTSLIGSLEIAKHELIAATQDD